MAKRKEPPRQQRILTICQGGNVRSVACGYVLKYLYNIDAIACSWEKNSLETITMLCKWADRIIVMENKFLEKVPVDFRSKVTGIDVGPDRWGNSLHLELVNLIVTKLNEFPARAIVS